jgi:ParB family chromosome partitioning protein
MSIKLSQLRNSAQEFIDIMKLTDEVDGKKVKVRLTDDMGSEDYIKLIKSCMEMIEPDDPFSKETTDLVEELRNLKEGEEIAIEVEEVIEEYSLEDEISKMENLKGLKEICQAEPQFKAIRGKLGSFKDVDALKEEMMWLLSDTKTPMTEQKLPLEETQQQVAERISKKNVEDVPVKTMENKFKTVPRTQDLEEVMLVENLVMIKPFKDIFEIDEKVLQSVTESMATKGYDKAFPIITWEDVVVDGHTRLKAALANGIEKVPVIHKKFKDEKEAVEYAIHNQRDRRNLSEAEILHCIQLLDKPMTKAEAGKKGGSVKTDEKIEKAEPTHKKTAKIVKVGQSKVTDARVVLTDKKAKADVEAGKKTIKEAAKEVREKKQAKSGQPVKEKVVKLTTKELLDEAVELIKYIYAEVEEAEIAEKCALFLEKVK